MNGRPLVDMNGELNRASRVYIGNLPQGYEEENVVKLVKDCGNILGTRLGTNFMFIQFQTDEAAQKAIKQNGKLVYKGKPLKVSSAKTNINKNATQPNPPKVAVKRDATGAVTMHGKSVDIVDPGLSITPTTSEAAQVLSSDSTEDTDQCEIIIDKDSFVNRVAFLIDHLEANGIRTNIVKKNEEDELDNAYKSVFLEGCLYAIYIKEEQFNERQVVNLKMADCVNEYKGMWSQITEIIIYDYVKRLIEKFFRVNKLNKKEYEVLISYFQKCKELAHQSSLPKPRQQAVIQQQQPQQQQVVIQHQQQQQPQQQQAAMQHQQQSQQYEASPKPVSVSEYTVSYYDYSSQMQALASSFYDASSRCIPTSC